MKAKIKILLVLMSILFCSCKEYYTAEVMMMPLYRETLFPFSEDDIFSVQDGELLYLDNSETISLLEIIKEINEDSEKISKLKMKSIAIEIEEFNIHKPSVEEEIEITEREVNVRAIIKIKEGEDIKCKLILGNNPYNLIKLNDEYYAIGEKVYKSLVNFLEEHSKKGFLLY